MIIIMMMIIIIPITPEKKDTQVIVKVKDTGDVLV